MLIGLMGIAWLAGCAAPATATATSVPSTANAIALAMLRNIQTNGWDNNAAINNGLGGLWVNWQYGTHPLQVNFNGTGQPDGASVSPPRHDPLTDLRYLHALWLYRSQHPTDTQFNGDIAKYTPIVLLEFGDSSDERGWIFDELLDLWHLSQNPAFEAAARNLAQHDAATLAKSSVPVMLKTTANHPNGYYRVDLELESGCALIQAGTLFQQPAWVSQGQQTVAFIFSHAYVPQYHTLLFELDNVLQADGTVNPDETIYRDTYQHTKVDGSLVQVGATALEVLSLLHAFMATHDQTLLHHATDLLAPLTAQDNLLQLWDAQNGGYFASATFPGSDSQNPGQPRVPSTNKESGRQLQMLEAFRLANTLTNHAYQSMQDALTQVLLTKAYYAPGHGILFQVTANWSPTPLKSGIAQAWVTTEAMGIGLEALFALSATAPW
jgi:hypothetical protein